MIMQMQNSIDLKVWSSWGIAKKIQSYPLEEAFWKINLNITKIRRILGLNWDLHFFVSQKKNQGYSLGEASIKIMLNFNLPRNYFFFENVTSLGLAKFQNYPHARLAWAPDQSNQADRQS